VEGIIAGAGSAQWLVERRVTLFGTNLIGLDNPDEWWEPTHVAFLQGGLPMVQQLCNLERLQGKEFVLVSCCR
jgi:arylformamidase